MLVFLHGAGERGHVLSRLLIHGPWHTAASERCLIVAPQCPADVVWPALACEVVALVEQVCSQVPVDRSRIVLTGISLGAFGAWAVAAQRPQLFSAVVPICGGLAGRTDLSTSLSDVLRLTMRPPQADIVKAVRGLRAWLFHGRHDRTVSMRGSWEAYNALGGASRGEDTLRITIFEDIGHKCWGAAYCAAGLWEWLFDEPGDAARAAGAGATPPGMLCLDDEPGERVHQEARTAVTVVAAALPLAAGGCRPSRRWGRHQLCVRDRGLLRQLQQSPQACDPVAITAVAVATSALPPATPPQRSGGAREAAAGSCRPASRRREPRRRWQWCLQAGVAGEDPSPGVGRLRGRGKWRRRCLQRSCRSKRWNQLHSPRGPLAARQQGSRCRWTGLQVSPPSRKRNLVDVYSDLPAPNPRAEMQRANREVARPLGSGEEGALGGLRGLGPEPEAAGQRPAGGGQPGRCAAGEH